jgi:hypothetical protein
MGIWTDLWRVEAESWAFGHIGNATPIIPQKEYVSVALRQLRIVNSRVGFNRFYGVVEFFGRLPHLSGAPVEFASMTSPNKLRDIPKKDRGNFAIGDQRLLGPVPYVGGDLEIEIGLFTIKSQDLLMPYLELLGELSKSAGMAYLSVAAPYVAAIKQGAAALIGTEGSSSLEIGAAITFNPVLAGTYFAARISSAEHDIAKFTVDSSNHLLDEQGRHLDEVPYLIFSVTQSGVRDDWYQIPAISSAYNKLMKAVREQKSLKEVSSYLEHFRRVVLTDPDILSGHGPQIVSWVEERVATVLGPIKTSRDAKGPALPALRTLQLAPLQ